MVIDLWFTRHYSTLAGIYGRLLMTVEPPAHCSGSLASIALKCVHLRTVKCIALFPTTKIKRND